MDWVWNFEDIVVASGGWWLALIGLLLLLGGIAIGYYTAREQDRKRYRVP